MVPPSSNRISRVPPYSIPKMFPSNTGLSPSLAVLPSTFLCQNTLGNGLVRFRSPLLSKSRLISFPPGTEMFQFPGFRFFNLCIQLKIPHMRGVPPFGNQRIIGHSHLPAAYRSVSRPSSPLDGKASSKCPFALDSSLFVKHISAQQTS